MNIPGAERVQQDEGRSALRELENPSKPIVAPGVGRAIEIAIVALDERPQRPCSIRIRKAWRRGGARGGKLMQRRINARRGYLEHHAITRRPAIFRGTIEIAIAPFDQVL